MYIYSLTCIGCFIPLESQGKKAERAGGGGGGGVEDGAGAHSFLSDWASNAKDL